MAARPHWTADAGEPDLSPKRLSNQFVVEEVAIGNLIPNPAPQRIHGERKIIRLMGAIEAFGQLPILVTDHLIVLDGGAALEACRRLGRKSVTVIRVSHLSPNAQRGLMMAINRLGEDAKWDQNVISADFQVLMADPEITFSLEVTGFDQTYVDGLLMAPSALEQDEVPEPPKAPVCRLSDLWCCRGHRIVCGDSLKHETYAQLLGQERARLIAGDVPYNVKIAGNVSGLGRHKHGEFAMASGEMTRAEFVAFQTAVFAHCRTHALDGALAYYFIDGRHVRDQIEAGEAVYGALKQLIVWDHGVGAMGAFYRSQHELVTIWKVGEAPHVNTFGLGGSGRYRTNVWSYPGMASFGKGRDEALAAHPTVKPLALIVDLILDVTLRGDIVLDPFGGSGTTMIAAERTGRWARLIEIDPGYVDVCLQRFMAATGEQPTLEATGETFAAVADRRAVESDPSSDEWDIL